MGSVKRPHKQYVGDEPSTVSVKGGSVPLFKKREDPGNYKGRHYTEYVEPVKALKRLGKYEEAEQLLLALVDAVESEANDQKRRFAFSPPPWYYDELAKIYRRAKDYPSEIAILERYLRLERKTVSYTTDTLVARLAKARSMLARQKP